MCAKRLVFFFTLGGKLKQNKFMSAFQMLAYRVERCQPTTLFEEKNTPAFSSLGANVPQVNWRSGSSDYYLVHLD